MKKEVGDWTVGAKLNDEHVSEQEAERTAEVNALRAENEKLKKQLEKAEALITDLSVYLTGMIEWMHGLPDSTQGVNRVEHQTRGIAQSVVVYMSRMRKRIGNGQSIGGINE